MLHCAVQLLQMCIVCVQVSKRETLLIPHRRGEGSLPLHVGSLEKTISSPSQLHTLLQQHKSAPFSLTSCLLLGSHVQSATARQLLICFSAGLADVCIAYTAMQHCKLHMTAPTAVHTRALLQHQTGASTVKCLSATAVKRCCSVSLLWL